MKAVIPINSTIEQVKIDSLLGIANRNTFGSLNPDGCDTASTMMARIAKDSIDAMLMHGSTRQFYEAIF